MGEAEILLFHHAQVLPPGVIEFANSSLPSYDAVATSLLLEQVLEFIDLVK